MEWKDRSIQINELSIYDIKFIYCLRVEWKKKRSDVLIACFDIKFTFCLCRVKRHSCTQEREIAPKKWNISHHCTLSDRFVGFICIWRRLLWKKNSL